MISRFRPPVPAYLGLLVAAAVLAPPGATAARHYVWAQALQFGVLAFAVPALLVLGAPWRSLAAAPRRPWPPWAALVVYLAVVITWRLPIAVNAAARHHVVLIAEAVTLVAAGCALWLELVSSPPLVPRLSRPLRAAFAALAMWTVWAIGYILGFSGTAWFSSYSRPSGRGLSIMADQQIAAALLWAVPGLVCVPLIYVCLMSWLRDGSDPDAELGAVRPDLTDSGQAALHPPRGWRPEVARRDGTRR